LADGITGQIVDVAGERISLHGSQQSEARVPREGRWTPQELHRRWTELTQS
jgi:hypothetical protein